MTARIKYLIEILILFSLCYFPLCYRMDALAIRQWDEARNAVHTAEMMQNHNFLVRTYEGVPETWEPKPPFLIWLQVASAKIFGLNELAIRFPIMLATFFTVVMLVLYFARFFHNRFTGYIAVMILVTSQGFIDRHIARTGDHDALLILFTTAIILHFYQLLLSDKPEKSQFIGIGILFILGVYSKSVAAFFIVPGLLLSVIAFKSGRKVFLNRWFYFSFALFILITGIYYVSREIIQPGYLAAVWKWELFPRYANTEKLFLADGFWYYIINFYKSRFTYWMWVLPPAVILLPLLTKGQLRRFSIYLIINTSVLLIVISIGSKNLWYDGPLYPLFAMIIALFFYAVYTLIIEKLHLNRTMVNIAGIIAMIGILVYPYTAIAEKVSRTEEWPWDRELYSMGYVLRDQGKLDQLPDPLKIVFEGYNAHLLFYAEAENYKQQKERLIPGNFSSVKPGDVIIFSQEQVMDSVKGKFNHEILYTNDPVRVIRVTEP